MVVYLYKKGRQIMKNIITTIAMFILTIGAQAQTITTDSFYQFTHDTTISTFEASEKNQCKNIGWVVGKVKYEFFDESKTIIITYVKDGVEVMEYMIVNKKQDVLLIKNMILLEQESDFRNVEMILVLIPHH